MPLYKTITPQPHTKVLIWKIDEPFDVLNKDISLTPHCQNRIDSMKSEMHRRGFMSIRHLLKEVSYDDRDLWYDDFGKPHLYDGNQISITHSYNFSAIIISNQQIGIDIEKQREKITSISHKFVHSSEEHFFNNEQTRISLLTIIWCVKESLYKLYATPGLSFKDHIKITEVDFSNNRIKSTINYKGKRDSYELAFIEFEGFTCAYVIP